MGLISKSNVTWCDYKWKPYEGCERGCSVETCGYDCYAKRDFKRYQHLKPEMRGDFSNVTFFEREFSKSFPKKPARIFISESTDPEYWDYENSNRIWNKIADNQQHTFILLTKQILVYDCWCWHYTFGKLKNLWCGLTVNTSTQMGGQDIFNLIPNKVRFLSIEPIKEEIPLKLFKPYLLDWIILGGQSGPGEKFYPSIKWIAELTKFCDKNKIPLFYKNNLRIDRGGWSMKPAKRYQWPEGK